MSSKKTTATEKKNYDASKFEELRRRALDQAGVDTSAISDEPFVMGADWGFSDTPVTVTRPKFSTSELISDSLRAGQILNALRLIFGADTSKVTGMIDTLGKDAAPAALLLIDDVLAHFYGPGAAQVFPR